VYALCVLKVVWRNILSACQFCVLYKMSGECGVRVSLLCVG
jgi:hypothetical protein